jgi:beta-1,4-mannosyl-glycoprotein beta-1,4-N-acetylglucosaminyltransferase
MFSKGYSFSESLNTSFFSSHRNINQRNLKWKSLYKNKIIKFSKIELLVLTAVVLIYFLIINTKTEISSEILPEKGYLITKKGKGQRIFDTWMYNNEAEMAYTRIWRLYDYVDAFIICVSNISHSGQPKFFTFKPFTQDIKKYDDKIHVVYVPSNYCIPGNDGNGYAWCIETSQRDYAIEYIEQNFRPTTNDIMLVSDVDEIFTRDAVKFIAEHPPLEFYFVPGVTYFPYYFHFVENWSFSLAVRYSKHRRQLSRIRNIANSPKIEYYTMKMPQRSVTHCSYCFRTLQQYKNKLLSFAHQEFNTYPYTTNDWIFKSHYCREKINSGVVVEDEKDTNWSELIPNDERLRFLYDPSYHYDLNLTSYTEKDLENLCQFKFRRTPF